MCRRALAVLISLFIVSISFGEDYKLLYKKLELSDNIGYETFAKAMRGYNKLDGKSGELAIIDYNKPSSKKRLVVLDLKNKRVKYETEVAHAKNSDNGGMAKNFSNSADSKKTSLGFYKTASTYNGKNGYSLRVDGLEKGINHNVRRRSVVFHGANYVYNGYAGRSWGCFAVNHGIKKGLFNTIKGGTVLFVDGRGYKSTIV